MSLENHQYGFILFFGTGYTLLILKIALQSLGQVQFIRIFRRSAQGMSEPGYPG